MVLIAAGTQPPPDGAGLPSTGPHRRRSRGPVAGHPRRGGLRPGYREVPACHRPGRCLALEPPPPLVGPAPPAPHADPRRDRLGHRGPPRGSPPGLPAGGHRTGPDRLRRPFSHSATPPQALVDAVRTRRHGAHGLRCRPRLRFPLAGRNRASGGRQDATTSSRPDGPRQVVVAGMATHRHRHHGRRSRWTGPPRVPGRPLAVGERPVVDPRGARRPTGRGGRCLATHPTGGWRAFQGRRRPRIPLRPAAI